MKKVKHIFTVFALIISTYGVTQQLTINIGRVTSNFDYTDSNGEKNLDLFSETNFSYEVGYRKDISKRFHYHGTALLNKYSNYGTDLFGVNAFTWDISYVGLDLGVDTEIFKEKGFSVFLRAAGGPQFMVSGKQGINNDVISLKGVEQFDTPLLFVRPALGFNYCAEQDFGISLKYTYGTSFALGGNSDGEKLSINTGTVSIGLLWSLNGCDYCYNRKR